jgi:cytochrome b6-f complex iron-sulfur subunit
MAVTTLLTASGALATGGLLRFLDFQAEPPKKTEFDLGPASNYPANSRTLLPEVPAVLIHAQSGFVALSLICTHLGCTVDTKPDGFVCPCHGSKYDMQGTVLRGPAAKSLRHLRIETADDGHLLLHTD